MKPISSILDPKHSIVFGISVKENIKLQVINVLYDHGNDQWEIILQKEYIGNKWRQFRYHTPFVLKTILAINT